MTENNAGFIGLKVNTSYRHSDGRAMRVLTWANTYHYGATLIAEQLDGQIVPVGATGADAKEWRQISDEEFDAMAKSTPAFDCPS